MTRREQDILDFLGRWFRENRISPSYEEIGKGIGLKSKCSVHRLVHSLIRRGLITLEVGDRRKRVIIPPDRDELLRAARGCVERAILSETGFFLVHPADFQPLLQAVQKSKPKGESHDDHQP